MVSRSTSRPFPGFDHVYEFRGSSAPRAFVTEVELPPGIDGPALIRGEWKPDQPLVARWTMGGKQPADVIWSTWLTVMFSQRIVDALTQRRFTGWSTYPVDVYGKDGAFVTRYHGICIHGRCGPIDGTRSTRVMREYPAGLFPISQGLLFDEASWDGSDFFIPGETAFNLVTEDVKNTIEKLKARHITFTALDQFLWGDVLPGTP
jgi:hypothetical protein